MVGTLSSLKAKSKTKLSGKKIGLVVAQWNKDITEALFLGAQNFLLSSGIKKKNIIRVNVPGSFELPLGALRLATNKSVDAVICIGCVIKGFTPHFEYICSAVANGIMSVNLKYKKPIGFGVLTTLNKKQALERAGGKFGNKGEEAAYSIVEMLD